MSHHFIGKLCQYKSEHKEKVLFTYSLSEEELAEIKYTINIWNDQKSINSYTNIPTWYYSKYIKNQKTTDPDPTTYHTPYVIKLYDDPSYMFEPEKIKIKSFLIVDSKTFSVKIGNIVAGQRTFLKVLFTTSDMASFCWVDQEWIELYSIKETYVEQLKAKMLNKLRQNT